MFDKNKILDKFQSNINILTKKYNEIKTNITPPEETEEISEYVPEELERHNEYIEEKQNIINNLHSVLEEQIQDRI